MSDPTPPDPPAAPCPEPLTFAISKLKEPESPVVVAIVQPPLLPEGCWSVFVVVDVRGVEIQYPCPVCSDKKNGFGIFHGAGPGFVEPEIVESPEDLVAYIFSWAASHG